MARGENPKFNLAKCDEREAVAHEAPPHRDGDVTISPREANSWREVSSPMNLHRGGEGHFSSATLAAATLATATLATASLTHSYTPPRCP